MSSSRYDDGEGITFADSPDEGAGYERNGDLAPGAARHASVLGNGKSNALGDLHALQQLCDRQARGVRGVFEPLLRRQPRIVAEPLRVERFDDYLARMPDGIASFSILKMAPLNGSAMVVMEGALVLSMVDLFFGGPGIPPSTLPNEFTPTEDAIAKRAVLGIVEVLGRTWVELAEVSFHPAQTEHNRRMLSHLDGEDPVVICRFELTLGDGRTSPVDIVYPVAALKPLAPVLCAKVQSRRVGDLDPRWRSTLTRAVMNVPLPIRSVVAEPVVKLSTLVNLQIGDIIPIELPAEIPLLVASNRFGRGTVGQQNGRTALRIEQIDTLEDEEL
jgi:flagellar motor switch protein FliM